MWGAWLNMWGAWFGPVVENMSKKFVADVRVVEHFEKFLPGVHLSKTREFVQMPKKLLRQQTVGAVTSDPGESFRRNFAQRKWISIKCSSGNVFDQFFCG